MGSEGDAEEAGAPEKSRGKRNFLKLIIFVGGVATLGAIASAFRVLGFVPSQTQSTIAQSLSWPRIKITNARSLDPSKAFRFNYPLVDTPSVLIKLGVRADNGIGPDGDIVAYSNVCQHLGCIYALLPSGSSPPCNSSYTASGPEGYCCCHGGQYDLAHGAKVIGGPPPRPVPPVLLEYDLNTGDIYAVGMGPPTIFGHGPPGTTEPGLVLQNDLAGGEIVTQDTVLAGA